MLVRAAVAGIEHQRLLIMPHGRPQLAQPPIGIADVVLDVGVARVAQGRELERRDRAVPILGGQRLLAGGEIGIELRPVGFRPERSHGGANRPVFQSRASRPAPDRAHRARPQSRYATPAGRRVKGRPLRPARRGLPPMRSSGSSSSRKPSACGASRLRRRAPFGAPHHLLARNVLASRVSGRSVSAFFASSTSLP